MKKALLLRSRRSRSGGENRSLSRSKSYTYCPYSFGHARKRIGYYSSEWRMHVSGRRKY